jgi:hypothetical protein
MSRACGDSALNDRTRLARTRADLEIRCVGSSSLSPMPNPARTIHRIDRPGTPNRLLVALPRSAPCARSAFVSTTADEVIPFASTPRSLVLADGDCLCARCDHPGRSRTEPREELRKRLVIVLPPRPLFTIPRPSPPPPPCTPGRDTRSSAQRAAPPTMAIAHQVAGTDAAYARRQAATRAA